MACSSILEAVNTYPVGAQFRAIDLCAKVEGVMPGIKLMKDLRRLREDGKIKWVSTKAPIYVRLK